MPEQALYLKWRPQTFADVVGQEHITRTLRNALMRARIRHAYLFSGPRGTGKTTMARLLAKAVNCTHEDAAQRPCNACANCRAINEGRFLDLIEIDAASHTSVDDVRELRDKIAFSPGMGSHKVYIIDEVHRFSGNAFDALLKTLEEPPEHAIFVLATTEIDKVPATIKSRCLQFEFRRVSLREVSQRLGQIAKSESLSIEPAALDLIARQGTGSVRDSISLLDQIVADPQETISLELTQKLLGAATDSAVRDLVAALSDEDVARGLRIINEAIDSGSEPRQFGQQIVEYLRNIMLAQTAGIELVDATREDRERFGQLAGEMSRARLLRAIRIFNDAVNQYTGGWQPQLALELALIETQLQAERPPPAAPAPQPAPQSRPISRSELEKQAAKAASDDAASQPIEQGAQPALPVASIQQGWTQLLTRINQYNRSIPPLLEHAHLRAIDGNRLVLGVLAEIFRDKIAAPARAQVIEQAIYDLHQVRLRVEVQVVDQVAAPQAAAPAASPGEQDPLIAAGLQLGGVVDEAEKP